MSTRCQIMFHDGNDTRVICILYRHSDGYPEGVLPDLDAFFEDLQENVPDNRFGHPDYLAAKLLVWFTNESRVRMKEMYERMAENDTTDPDRTKYWNDKLKEGEHPCEFLGHGIDMCLHGDIEYLYHISCSSGYGKDVELPTVTWEHVTEEVEKRYAYLVKAADKQVKYPKNVIQSGIPIEAD